MSLKVDLEFSIAPVRMEKCFFPIIDLQAEPQFAARPDPDKPMTMNTELSRIKIEQSPDDRNRFVVQFRLEMTWPDADIPPYARAIIEAAGVFYIDPSADANIRTKMATITSVSILYASVREFLRSITSSGPWGEIILPGMTINAKTEPDSEQASVISDTKPTPIPPKKSST